MASPPTIVPADLRARRLALGLTQAELATRLRVATNTVARWERGERSIPPMAELVLDALAPTQASIAKTASQRLQ